MIRVLLLGAGGSAGINFARAIEGEGVKVIGVDVDPLALQLAHAHATLVLPPVDERTAGLVNHVIDAYGIDVIHAQPDAEVAWLARARAELKARTLLPSLDALEVCADKLATAQVLGRELAPRSYNVSSGALLDGLHGQAWMRLRRGAGSMGALPIRDLTTMEVWLEHWYQERGVTADEWMLAEILTGRDLSWTGVYADGELQASACKERVALMGATRHPANISSTASVQQIVVRADINERCEAAVERIDPSADGVWMVDLREDADGVPMITEVNCGRFGTTSQFWSEAAKSGAEGGANLPPTYLNAVLGVRFSDPLRDCCREGATWIRATDATPRLAT